MGTRHVNQFVLDHTVKYEAQLFTALPGISALYLTLFFTRYSNSAIYT